MFPKRNLFAGPYAGEFGWELMQWQGFIRARRAYYEHVHVLTYPGRDYLYEGCQVHHHDIDLKTAGYRYGTLSRDRARQIVAQKVKEIRLKDYDVFGPSLLNTRYHKAIWKQDFKLYQEPPLSKTPYDAVFHFRAVQKEGADVYKNYPTSAADNLVKLCFDHGLSLACIGHPSYSYCPSGCRDHRSVDLRQTVAAISSAHAVAGENSGPMHLANLCGKPTILWAQDQWRIDYSLRWNPFRVPIYVATNTTSQPDPQLVCNTIVNALRDLRQKSDGFSVPLYTLPAQPIADY
jgi:ADP-heptose:LPS heptosyltransferase